MDGEPNTASAELETILALLSAGSSDTFQRRFREAERLMFAQDDGRSARLERLLATACQRYQEFPHAEILFERAVSYVDETRLRPLAAAVLSAESRGAHVAGLLTQMACQLPQAFPDEVLQRTHEFGWWFEETDPLADQAAWHIVFEGRTPGEAYAANNTALHPTWTLPASGEVIVVGGRAESLCSACGKPRSHLISLHRIPQGIDVSLPRLTLETCPDCLGPAFFSHGADGRPVQIEPVPDVGFLSDTSPPRRIGVRLALTPKRWTRQAWASGQGQNLFRLGGLPSWIQYSEVPLVPGTSRPMQFLAQFDSFLEDETESKFLWGSGGLLYVFWDDESRTSCTFAQCT